MKNFRNFVSAALALTLSLSLAACGSQETTSDDSGDGSSPKYLIGISQYGQHGSLDNCREGFLQGLEEAGLKEGVDFEVDYRNADFDDTMTTQIGDAFSAEDVDLMVGIATNSAVACFNAAEDKDIPVIFTAITDPVGAHLDSGNITGTSDALPVAGQLELIRALQPDADTVGIIYTTSEPNSVYSVGIYEDLAADYGFTIDAVGVTSQAEVPQAVDQLIADGVDCLSNLTDNNVVGVLTSILEKTDEAGIPVYGSEVEQVKLGCVAGAGLDYVQLGIQTGKMAAKVLTGETTCEDLPYETIENYGLYINSDSLSALGITVPEDIAQSAQECAE
nr:ABC transporter substrate-binding protein [uncultured Dysosmobacter sp.]